MTVVDVHAHVFPEIGRAESRLLTGSDDGPWLRTTDGPGTGMMMAGSTEYRPVSRTLWDPAERVADLDRLGVDVQVLSSTPMLFGYGLEPERAVEWCRTVNAHLLRYAAHAPDRLAPSARCPSRTPKPPVRWSATPWDRASAASTSATTSAIETSTTAR